MKERERKQHYIIHNGYECGPFSIAQLERLFSLNEIEDKTLARVEGSDEWVEAWTLVPSRFVIPDDEYPESWKEELRYRKRLARVLDATSKGPPPMLVQIATFNNLFG